MSSRPAFRGRQRCNIALKIWLMKKFRTSLNLLAGPDGRQKNYFLLSFFPPRYAVSNTTATELAPKRTRFPQKKTLHIYVETVRGMFALRRLTFGGNSACCPWGNRFSSSSFSSAFFLRVFTFIYFYFLPFRLCNHLRRFSFALFSFLSTSFFIIIFLTTPARVFYVFLVFSSFFPLFTCIAISWKFQTVSHPRSLALLSLSHLFFSLLFSFPRRSGNGTCYYISPPSSVI